MEEQFKSLLSSPTTNCLYGKQRWPCESPFCWAGCLGLPAHRDGTDDDPEDGNGTKLLSSHPRCEKQLR